MQKVNPDRQNSKHITDHDLERYHLGMIVNETELAPLEDPAARARLVWPVELLRASDRAWPRWVS